MFLKLIILAFLAILHQTTSICNINSNYNTANCASLAEVQSEASQDWHVLNIKNYGNQSFQPIKPILFQNLPELQILTIQGIASGVDRNALKNLMKLQKVELFDNKFKTLPGNLFGNLPIENVYVVNCSMQKLSTGTFQNLDKLRTVYVRNNSIKVVPSDVFSDSNIEELYLEHNGIELLEDYAFVNMPKLYRIGLLGNGLTSFDVQRLFGSSSRNLDRIWLGKNKLNFIKSGHFSYLPKLRYLFLESNQISYLEDGAFHGLDKLKGLDLSNNFLYEISPNIFPNTGLESLELFFLHNNRMTFLTDVLDRGPNLKYVTVFGNPLQCPCEMEIKNYMAGRNISQVCNNNSKGRPVCILNDDPYYRKQCVKDVEKTKYLYDHYITLTKEYEDWEVKCEFLEGYENLGWTNYIQRPKYS